MPMQELCFGMKLVASELKAARIGWESGIQTPKSCFVIYWDEKPFHMGLELKIFPRRFPHKKYLHGGLN